MRVMRPFPKELLKKMFLKVLYENKEISTPDSRDSSFISIICEILTNQFNVSELSEYEFNEIIKAVSELESDGYIMPDSDSLSAKTKVLTEKGNSYAAKHLAGFNLPSHEIEKFITRAELKDQCLPDYLNGDYEASILKAFRIIEEISLSKSVKPSKFINKEKLSGSYISDGGKFLENSNVCEKDFDTIQRIMMGAMHWFNKPFAEKTNIANSPQAAAQILLFVNMHLNIIDQKKVII